MTLTPNDVIAALTALVILGPAVLLARTLRRERHGSALWMLRVDDPAAWDEAVARAGKATR